MWGTVCVDLVPLFELGFVFFCLVWLLVHLASHVLGVYFRTCVLFIQVSWEGVKGVEMKIPAVRPGLLAYVMNSFGSSLFTGANPLVL